MCNGDLMAGAIHHEWEEFSCHHIDLFAAIGVFDAPCESEEMEEARADCGHGCNIFKKNRFVLHFTFLYDSKSLIQLQKRYQHKRRCRQYFLMFLLA